MDNVDLALSIEKERLEAGLSEDAPISLLVGALLSEINKEDE